MSPNQPSQPTYADLEIRILDRPAGRYPVELTLDGRQLPAGALDPAQRPALTIADPVEDGQRLFGWLTADPAVKEAWNKANGVDGRCRIRLRIDAAAPELHTLPWEALRLPAGPGQQATMLAADDRTPFSRYLALASPPGSQIVDEKLRVLVAIADPVNLTDPEWDLGPIDRAKELAALQTAVAGLPLALTELTGPCTLAAIEGALRRGQHHVLHVVAHGVFKDDVGAALYLAGDDHRVRVEPAGAVAAMVGRLGGADKPALVFLSSCESAAASPADAFRGLAPQLMAAGVPAVLAMQEVVEVETARAFAGTFYRQLARHGIVDLAANQARAALLTARLPGAEIPALFMRVPDGKLLAIPEAGSSRPPLAGRPTPPPAPELVGRDRFMDDLAAELIRPSGAARLALTALRGLPGVGKTALALALRTHPPVHGTGGSVAGLLPPLPADP